ncbi:MAG TPA: hypothetical protein ENG03_04830 [Thioploca sp.]|nr:MAG: hypothetical protein DRR19_33580 [Gammaproteobacteria bacterium]HDN26410.1 hypothetical protein [Thioploca sp.]
MARTLCKSAKDYFDAMARVLNAINYSIVDAFVDRLLKAQVFGNGGSAHTAGHFVVLELVMTFEPVV